MIINGDHVVDYVDDYLHDLLDEEDAQYVHDHAAHCAICRTALDQAGARRSLLQTMPAAEPSQQLISRAMQKISGRKYRLTFRQLAWRTFGAAMAASVLIVGALHLYFDSLSASPYDLRVVVQSDMMPDTEASLRAVVARGDSSTPVKGANVTIDLIDPRASRNIRLAAFTTDDQGTGQPRFRLPDWKDGDYQIRITAAPGWGTETITRSIKLHRNWKLMLSTDKPVYQPGQTMHFRTLALRQPDLKPIAGQEAVFSITDPKGNVIFKTTSVTSRFGITSADCPLADEILEGPYSIVSRVGETESKQTVEVKKYVLPKFRIDLDSDKPYYQPGDRMKVSIKAGYFFGKPVAGGAVEIAARDGATVTNTTLQTDLTGSTSFALPIPQSLIGYPEDGGDARVTLDVLVRDAAGQEQLRSLSRVVSANPMKIEIVPESGQLTQGISNTLYVLTTYPDGTPASARVAISGLDHELATSAMGELSFELTPQSQEVKLNVRAIDDRGLVATRQIALQCSQIPGDFILRTDKAVYRGGETMKITALGGSDDSVFIDLIKDGQTLLTQTLPISKGRGEEAIDLPPEVFGTIQLSAYRIDTHGQFVRKSRVIYVEPAKQLKLQVTQDQKEYRPGDEAKLSFTLTDAGLNPVAGAISLAAVDEAVFSVAQQAPGMEQTFFTLQQELLKPIYSMFNWSPDFSTPASTLQRIELEKALFSRAADQPAQGQNNARALLERAVASGNLDREILEVLDLPDAARILDDTTVDDSIQPILREAIGQGSAMQTTYAQKIERVERRKYVGLQSVSAAWTALAVILIIAGIVRLGEVSGTPIATVLFLLLLSVFLVSILMPSLNRARETANRVKFAADLKAIGQGLLLDEKDHRGGNGGGGRGGGAAAPRLRQWFPETLLWRPELITDELGHAHINFDLADSITTWRLSASAVSAIGQLGASQSDIRVFQPFFVDMNLPVALMRNDEVAIPVAIYSYLDRDQSVELTLDRTGDWFELLGEPGRSVSLKAGEVGSASYRIRVKRVGMHELQITARGAGVADAVKRRIEIIPDGRRIEQVINGALQQPVSSSFSLPSDAIGESGKLFVKIYPSSFSQVVEGLDGIFQRPYGCFEQTSSTTYPNILALTYLRENNKSLPEIEARAKEYINLGYQRLVGFEVPGGGFDWFGHPDASVVLTAYGLMEFQDMQKVYNVDQNLIDRTRTWLLSKRNADGTWTAGQMIHDGLADSVIRGADATLASTAYVGWAVFGRENNRDGAAATLNYLRNQRAQQINDPYVVAVLAGALQAIDPDGASTAAAVDWLASLRKTSPDGKQVWWEQPGDSRTAFYGSGAGGAVETTAMATLAMIKSGRQIAITRGALTWLVAQKDSSGTWPSTQATVLALKALLTGTNKPLGGDGARSVQLVLGDGFSKKIDIPADQADVMQQIDLSGHLKPGENRVSLTESDGGASGYQTAFRYHMEGEAQPAEQPFTIALDYDQRELTVGQRMTATAVVANRMQQDAAMLMVDLPIPAGFEVDQADLAKMVQDGVAAKFQLTPRSILLYLRSMTPGQSIRLQYHLTATMPVKLTIPPGRVYEYYNPSREAASSPKGILVVPV